MKDRILQIIKEEDLTNVKFANEIGVQPSSISHIVSGRNKASIDLITKILRRFPRISTDWLMLGKGSMYKADNNMSDYSQNLGNRDTQADLFSQNNAQQKESIDVNKDAPDIEEDFSKADEPEERSSYFTNVNSNSVGKKVEKIVIFYSDKTFSEYYPE